MILNEGCNHLSPRLLQPMFVWAFAWLGLGDDNVKLRGTFGVTKRSFGQTRPEVKCNLNFGVWNFFSISFEIRALEFELRTSKLVQIQTRSENGHKSFELKKCILRMCFISVGRDLWMKFIKFYLYPQFTIMLVKYDTPICAFKLFSSSDIWNSKRKKEKMNIIISSAAL